jgi:putative transposase
MRRRRFTEEQIILKEADAGAKPGDVCRRHGIGEKSYYRWKAKYAGLEVSGARRLRQLADEKTRLKRVVADLTLDNQVLKELLGKKPSAPAAQRTAVWAIQAEHEMSERRACALVGIGGRPIATGPGDPSIKRCASACGAWPPNGAALGIAGSMSCSVAKAIGSISSASTACTVRKG